MQDCTVAQLYMMGLLGEEDMTVLEACDPKLAHSITAMEAMCCIRKEHARRAYIHGYHEPSVMLLSNMVNKLAQSIHLAHESMLAGEPVAEFMLILDGSLDGQIITAPINMSEVELKDYAQRTLGIRVQRVIRVEYVVTGSYPVDYSRIH